MPRKLASLLLFSALFTPPAAAQQETPDSTLVVWGKAVTKHAHALGRGGSHGVVDAGRVADLVLLRADPLSSIDATTDIRRVIRRGRVLDVGR